MKTSILATLLLFAVNVFCMENDFIYDIQRGGYAFDQSDEMGNINFHDFIAVINKFPWVEEIEKANKAKNGVSPTVGVTDQSINKVLWLSASGEANQYGYLLGIVYDKTERSFFGFGKERTKRWVTVYLTEDMKVIEKAYEMFFKQNYSELSLIFANLEVFIDAESP